MKFVKQERKEAIDNITRQCLSGETDYLKNEVASTSFRKHKAHGQSSKKEEMPSDRRSLR